MESNTRKIKNFIFDVDGVFTTGQFLYTTDGKFAKVFGAHDNDGIKLIKPYLEVHVITADKRGFEITQKRIAEDMRLILHLVGEGDRLKWMQKNFNLEECVFMGDSMHDAKIFGHVAYSISPSNAFFIAKKEADFVTEARSGEGAVAEACWHVIEKFFGPLNIKKL
ncbi:MAG: phosphatase [Candidatus Magasanikbacteria bacterium CG_4_9_14_3_um_filter_32_9]|uniref:Phosphatase n=1 Tax=Candidatus Magasanikbacteria bacterium CG_4_9_14_3_um_filter_32_9 TaxID=1974644 RepID=A0A2M7Z7C6_9BACT|nr:MAG: phosphatase [Candidatus Magasanikbacteria bacterium CG_4_9_14_3_um_filter_32_9]